MKRNEDELRRTYQSFVRGKVPASRQGCPAPEALLESFGREAPLEMKNRVVTHISQCSSCAREFELIRQTLGYADDLAGSFERIYGKPASSSGRGRWIRSLIRRPAWGFAALSLILVSAGVLLLTYRSGGVRTEGRGVDISASGLRQPVGLVNPSAPLVFIWKPGEGIKYYFIEVSDEALLPVWRSPRVYSNSLVLPPAVQSKLRSGHHYYWSVAAIDLKGNRSESGVRMFVLMVPEKRSY